MITIFSDEGKSQDVRLLDVVVVGPVMIAGAMAIPDKKLLRTTLFIFGIATIIYNYLNWLRLKDLPSSRT